MTNEHTTRVSITLHVDTADAAIDTDTAGTLRALFADASDAAVRFVLKTVAMTGCDDTLSIRDGNGNTIGTMDISVSR